MGCLQLSSDQYFSWKSQHLFILGRRKSSTNSFTFYAKLEFNKQWAGVTDNYCFSLKHFYKRTTIWFVCVYQLYQAHLDTLLQQLHLCLWISNPRKQASSVEVRVAWVAYLIFVSFFTLADSKACKFYTQKCVNSRQKLSRDKTA